MDVFGNTREIRRFAHSVSDETDCAGTDGNVAFSVASVPVVPLLQSDSFGPVAIVGSIVILGVVALLAYVGSKSETSVQLTNTRVELERKAPVSYLSRRDVIPYGEIQRVEYTDSTEDYHLAESRDERDVASGGGTFSTGEGVAPITQYNVREHGGNWKGDVEGVVRIERTDDPPVYFGSARFREQATTIAERVPHVESAKKLERDPSGLT